MDVIDSMRAWRQGQLSVDQIFRRLLSFGHWQVPVDAAGSPALFEVEGALHLVASVDPKAPGARMHEWMSMSGAHLIRHLPDECAGVVFEPLHAHAQAVSGEALLAARHWATVLAIEGALERPGPGQVGLFLDHDWIVSGQKGEPSVQTFHAMQAVHVFTAADHWRAFVDAVPAVDAGEFFILSGQRLFTLMSARDDFDAVVINRHPSRPSTTLSPAAVQGFSRGEERRLEARILSAQTIAEIHLFLDLTGLAQDDRTHALVEQDGRLVARYEATQFGGGRVAFHFELVMPVADPQSLGSEASQILCAGALGETLRRRRRALAATGLPGDAHRRSLATEAIRWTRALLLLVPDGSTRVPRSELRTDKGAWWARESPQILEKAWLSDTLRWFSGG